MKMQPWSRKSILSCVPTQYVPGTLPMLWGSTNFSISSGFQWIYCWHLIVLLLLSFPFRDHGARKREREERENADHWGGRGRRCNCTFLAFIWNNLDHVTGKQVCDWSDPSREPMRREEGPFSTRYGAQIEPWKWATELFWFVLENSQMVFGCCAEKKEMERKDAIVQCWTNDYKDIWYGATNQSPFSKVRSPLTPLISLNPETEEWTTAVESFYKCLSRAAFKWFCRRCRNVIVILLYET